MPYTIIDAAEWLPELTDRERSASWVPDFQNQAGPPALDGTRQYRNTNGGGLWRAAFNTVQLRSKAQVLAWQAMEVTLRGGMTPVDVPYCGYRPQPITGTVATIQTVDGWAARDVAGRIQLVDSTELEAGMHFSDYDAAIYGWRMYRVESVTQPSSPGTSDMRDITFWPPARFAAGLTGHQLEIDHPRCVMQLADSGSMDLELELRKRGNPNVEFIEAF